MRLIDADELIRCIPREEIASRIAVENAPTIDPVRHGKWIRKIGMVTCDQCLRAIRRIDCDGLLNYCPNCGARMKEEEDETDRC